jgi:plastocyanin
VHDDRNVRLSRLVVLTAVALAAAHPVPALAQQTPASVDAKIIDFAYAPPKLEVELGATVTWTNTGSRPHTATDRGGTFDTDPILPSANASVTFTVPGTYSYFCRINPSRMNGVIVVKPGNAPAPVSRIQAVDPALPGESLRFDPVNLTVPTGSTVLVANVGGKPHTLTADGGAFKTEVIVPGTEGGRFAGTNATFSVNQPGTFPFHCDIHPQTMKGVLTVVGAAKQGPAAASAAPPRATADVVDFAFKPPQLSVAPSGTVTWKNTGKAPHTATFDDVPLDTASIEPGAAADLTAPSQPGSYSYHCAIHPDKMRAVLVVVGGGTKDPTAGAAAGSVARASKSGRGRGTSGGIVALTAVAGLLVGVGGAAVAGRRRRHEATSTPSSESTSA